MALEEQQIEQIREEALRRLSVGPAADPDAPSFEIIVTAVGPIEEPLTEFDLEVARNAAGRSG